MKTLPRALFVVAAVALFCGRAVAQDAGAPACMTDRDCKATPKTPSCCVGSSCMPINVCVSCVDFMGNPCVPTACDGALCDTTTGSTCSVGQALGGPDTGHPFSLLILLAGVAFALLLRRGSRTKERGR